jgi:anti-sigma factor RsiW
MAKFPPMRDEDREKLIAFLDGELDDQAARHWEARLSRDPQAQAEAEALRRTWQMLDYLPQPEASQTFSSRTLERVSVMRPAPASPRVPSGWQPWLFGSGWAAAVAAAGLVGFAGVNYLAPAPASRPAASAAKAEPADLDQQLLRDVRVVENRHLYENVDDIDFLRELANDPELFGDGN